MFSDLKVTIVEGCPDPELWKGMYPPYLYFSSREGKFRSGKWKIKEDGCRVYYEKDGTIGEDSIILDCYIEILD